MRLENRLFYGETNQRTFRDLDLGIEPESSSTNCRFWILLTHEIAMTHPDPCLLYTSPSPRDRTRSRMPSSA